MHIQCILYTLLYLDLKIYSNYQIDDRLLLKKLENSENSDLLLIAKFEELNQ